MLLYHLRRRDGFDETDCDDTSHDDEQTSLGQRQE